MFTVSTITRGRRTRVYVTVRVAPRVSFKVRVF